MKKYLITITMPDGSTARDVAPTLIASRTALPPKGGACLLGAARRWRTWGLYASDWDAIDAYMLAFPGAASVTPRRLP